MSENIMPWKPTENKLSEMKKKSKNYRFCTTGNFLCEKYSGDEN